MKPSAQLIEAGVRPWPRVRLLNVWIDDLTMNELMVRLEAGVVFTLNLDHLYLLQRNSEFLAAYRNADVVTADSKYVYWSLRWIGRSVRQQVPGSDIVPTFCRYHRNNPNVKIFLLGAAPGVADKAMARMNTMAGRKMVVAAHSPSMKFVNDENEIADVLRLINDSGATVLIVGLGAPKQETWIHRHRDALPGIKIFMGVGATIDYEAGIGDRGPDWMARHGLEWFHRVVTQPRRYGRRYLRDLEFFWLLLLDWLGLYRPPALGTPVASNSSTPA